jgi:hypothetical protein
MTLVTNITKEPVWLAEARKHIGLQEIKRDKHNPNKIL